ncbi:uncharacterized protein [Misgurnus anguillicaudatus]|uniref:uncharacterized protein isoform X2 n=1 Tax=Misgurnus anguillicaudatus TaxID=75329 RepID=UPI003CCF2E2C
MDVFQPWILHLNLFVIFTLLIYADHSKTSVPRTLHQINQTAVVGDTVTLYCNNTEHINGILKFDDITWKRNNVNIFTQASFSNKTQRNFTSDRMFINPAVPLELKLNQIQALDEGNYSCHTSTTAIGWILTVTENRSESLKQISYLYIIIPCTAVIIICLIISLTIWIHRTWKSNRDAGQRETGQDFSQTPARGGIQTQNSQYFERYNSLYGQV